MLMLVSVSVLLSKHLERLSGVHYAGFKKKHIFDSANLSFNKLFSDFVTPRHSQLVESGKGGGMKLRLVTSELLNFSMSLTMFPPSQMALD